MIVKAGRFGVFRQHRNVANDRAEGLTSNQGHNLSETKLVKANTVTDNRRTFMIETTYDAVASNLLMSTSKCVNLSALAL